MPAPAYRPSPRPSVGRGGADWTPLVVLVTTVTLTAVATVWTLERIQHPRQAAEAEPGPERDERAAPPEVDLWVGEWKPGVKVVLTSVWGDALPDRAHDDELRAGLRLPESSRLAWYTLLLFNVSDEPRTVAIEEGGLVVEAEDGRARLTSLPALLQKGEAHPSASLSAVLAGLGALRKEVVLPPGDAASLLVCFDRRLDLGGAKTVATADGAAFRRRRMGRGDLQRLIADPDSSQVGTL